MPEPPDRGLFPVAPGEMAILTVKLLRNNFERAKYDHQRRRHEFASHLRILDPRGAALRAANKCRGDDGIGGFPLDHEALRSLEIIVLDHHFRIGFRPGHETNLLQRRFVMNIGAQSGLVETRFEILRFGRLVKGCDRHHNFRSRPKAFAASDQTSTTRRVQDSVARAV